MQESVDVLEAEIEALVERKAEIEMELMLGKFDLTQVGNVRGIYFGIFFW